MEEDTVVEVDKRNRPSLEQVKALVDFMYKHEDLATAKHRKGFSRVKAKQLWTKLSNLANSIPGTTKNTQGWIRFWIDKKCMVKAKKTGRHTAALTPIEERIWTLCFANNESTRQKNPRPTIKTELSYAEEDSSDEIPLKRMKSATPPPYNGYEVPINDAEIEERQMAVMEKLVGVMDKQANALSQMAQSSFSSAQAMDRFAEASQIQALAIERLASTFENIGTAVHDVRNAIINIDYTMKRCYTMNQT